MFMFLHAFTKFQLSVILELRAIFVRAFRGLVTLTFDLWPFDFRCISLHVSHTTVKVWVSQWRSVSLCVHVSVIFLMSGQWTLVSGQGSEASQFSDKQVTCYTHKTCQYATRPSNTMNPTSCLWTLWWQVAGSFWPDHPVCKHKVHLSVWGTTGPDLQFKAERSV